MLDPVLVEVTRGGIVESAHRGAVAVCDARGRLILAIGDVEALTFPRSAIKAIQALPLIESGAADHFGLTDAQIALACASHLGAPVHAETAHAMLQQTGLDTPCLECGVHWPMGESYARQLAAAGKTPTALHNNCSGKHAGFICLSVEEKHDPKGYVTIGHPVQQRITRVIEEMTGFGLDRAPQGIDGCSIPAFAFPLRALAQGFARFGTGEGLDATRAQAAARIRASIAAAPVMVSGEGQFDTVAMQALGTRAFTKIGAEGVFCASLPELGLGIAIKTSDGAKRAAEMMIATVLDRFLKLTETEVRALQPWLSPVLTNWNGIEVGRMRPMPLLTGR